MTSKFPQADKAFIEMKRAFVNGTGCYLTSEMCQELGLTFISTVWDDYPPVEVFPVLDKTREL